MDENFNTDVETTDEDGGNTLLTAVVLAGVGAAGVAIGSNWRRGRDYLRTRREVRAERKLAKDSEV